jgi:thiosulfate/3-mercaptopyruvate sulfurtransferase
MRFPTILALLTLAGCTASLADTANRAENAPSKPAVSTAYPKPELLVESSDLAKHETAAQFIVLDARGRKAFDENRLPGARWVDAAKWAKAFGSGKDANAWSGRIGDLGVNGDSKVVIYDDNYSKDAARIWWILRYWGLADVRLLNGGWQGWKAARLALEAGKAQAPAAKLFRAVPQAKRLAMKEQILNALNNQSLQIVDARGQAEFCGIDRQTNKRAGAIPGAKQLEWIDLIDKPTRRFKTADEIRALFEKAGIELEKPTATHCQSGGRASVMAFVMELMGAAEVSNYYAGWSEWGNVDDTPIVAKKAEKR